MPELGKIAYEAYCKSVGWLSVNGDPLPRWHEQEARIARAWDAAAQAVARALTDPKPARIECGKADCPREATELLLVKDPRWHDWTVKPRCDVHPAAADVPILRKVMAFVEVVIVPLPAKLEAA